MAIPANHTFETLRQKVSKEIERITDPTDPRQAERLLAAFAKEQSINAMASTEAQRERYRVITGRTWEQDFMSVREVRFMTIGGLTGDELVSNLWRQLPDSRFKRFQELFCAPENWLIPRVSDGATGVSFLSANELNTCSVHPCLVSPDRIPNKLLQDLGLVTWPAVNPGPIETLKMKSTPEVIEGLKAIFDATRSLKGRNQRIRVVEEPTVGEGTLYPSAAMINPRTVGSILYVRDDGGADGERSGAAPVWRAPQRLISFYPDSYAASRKTVHQTRGYNIEIEAVRTLIESWKALNTKLDAQWRAGAPDSVKTALREELAGLIVHSREALAKATNLQKRRADEFFASIEDDLGKGGKNVGAMMARMVGAWRRLERRNSAIPRKSGFNESDRLELRDMKKLMHSRFDGVMKALPNAASILSGEISRRMGTFNTRFASDEARASAAESVLRRMYIPVPALTVTNVRPFLAFANALRGAYSDLSTAIEQQNAADARQATARMTVITKLQRANEVFEKLREDTAAGTTVPLKELLTAAKDLRALLNARDIFPRTRVTEFEPLYERVQHKANEVARGLEAYAKRGLDVGGRAEMYRNLRRFLDDQPKSPEQGTPTPEPLDIEAAVWALTSRS